MVSIRCISLLHQITVVDTHGLLNLVLYTVRNPSLVINAPLWLTMGICGQDVGNKEQLL